MVAPSLSAVAQTQLLVVLSETQRCVSYRMAVNKEKVLTSYYAYRGEKGRRKF